MKVVTHSYQMTKICLIEQVKRRSKPIYSLKGYIKNVIKKARQKPSPFTVNHMKNNDFLDFVKSTNFKNLLQPIDDNGEKFSWLRIHEFVVGKGVFGFLFKYDLKDEPHFCNFGEKKHEK